MTEYSCFIAESAEADLDEIYHNLITEYHDTIYAKRIIRGLLDSIEELSIFPYRYTTISNFDVVAYPLYRMVSKDYIIIYTIGDSPLVVTILRILHGKREWESIMLDYFDYNGNEIQEPAIKYSA